MLVGSWGVYGPWRFSVAARHYAAVISLACALCATAASAQVTNLRLDPALREIVADMPEDYEGRETYVTALAERENAVKLADSLIASDDQEAIKLGCAIAARLGPVAASLVRRLGDALLRVRASGETNSVVSSAVVEALIGIGSAGTAEAVRLAKGASQADSYDGRFEGFQVLEGLGPKGSGAIPYLLDVIGDEDRPDQLVNYVSKAVGALAAMREAALPDLCRTITGGILANPTSNERRAAEAALWAIARSNYAAAQPTTCISEAVHSADPKLRRLAVGAARSLGGGDAVRILARGLLEDLDPEVRSSAASEIKKLGDPALPFLGQAVRSPVQDIRSNGWYALSRLEKTPAKEALLRRLESASDESIRLEASLMAAEEFGVEEPGLENLAAVMRSEDEYDRYRAVAALITAPAGHHVADQILGLAITDPSSLVRRSAYDVIVKKNITSAEISKPLFASISRRLSAHHSDEQLEAEVRVAALAAFVGREKNLVRQVLSGGDTSSKLEIAEAIRISQEGASFASELIALVGAKEFDLQVSGREALLSAGPNVVEMLLSHIRSEDAAAQENVLEILAIADTDGKSVPEIVRVARSSAMPGSALAALIVISERSDEARSALSRLWPIVPSVEKVSAVRKLKRYGLLEGEQTITWTLSVLRQADHAWGEELLRSLSLKHATAEQVALAERLEPQLHVAFVQKLAFDAPELVARAQVSQLLGDADTFRAALDIISELPPGIAETLNFTTLARHRRTDHPLEERLAIARASNGLAVEPRLELWLQGLSDSSDAVRNATLHAIASADTSKLAVLREGTSDDKALRALGSVTARVRTLMEEASDPHVLIPAIRAYPPVADPLDESVNEVLVGIIFSSDEETASVAVLALKILPGGRDSLVGLASVVENAIIAHYIRKALEPPGLRYSSPPHFSGFDSDFPRLMPWPPGRFTDRVTFAASEVGSLTTTLGSFLHRLKISARVAGYPEPSIYAIPGGFAAALAPERLGVSSHQRWNFGKLPLATVNPADYLRNLFLGSNEEYRWLVFYASSIDFAAPRTQFELDEARNWASSGYSGLPPGVSEQLAAGYNLGVISYEFSRDDTSEHAFASPSASQPLREQLRDIGLYDALFSPFQLAAQES